MAGLQKRSRFTPPPRPPTVEYYEHIQFRDWPQREKFIRLKETPMIATRFLDARDMRTLGWDDALRALFTGTGMTSFYDMFEFSFEDITLEFLSSFILDEEDGYVRYRLLNVDYSPSLREFAQRLGVTFAGQFEVPNEFSYRATWLAMTGERGAPIGGFRMNKIHHPHLRVFHRAIAASIFGRPETTKVNKIELAAIGSYLNVERMRRFQVDISLAVARHLRRVADGDMGQIVIGGVITYILKSHVPDFTRPDYEALESPIPTIGITYLRQKHKWLYNRPGGLQWKVSADRYIPVYGYPLPVLEPLPEARGFTDYPTPSYVIHADAGPPPPRVLVLSDDEEGGAGGSRGTVPMGRGGVHTDHPGSSRPSHSGAPIPDYATLPHMRPRNFGSMSEYEAMCYQMQLTQLHMSQMGFSHQEQVGYQTLRALHDQGHLQPHPIPPYYDPVGRGYLPQQGVAQFDLSAFHTPSSGPSFGGPTTYGGRGFVAPSSAGPSGAGPSFRGKGVYRGDDDDEDEEDDE